MSTAPAAIAKQACWPDKFWKKPDTRMFGITPADWLVGRRMGTNLKADIRIIDLTRDPAADAFKQDCFKFCVFHFAL